MNIEAGFIQKILTLFQGLSRTTLDFQVPATGNIHRLYKNAHNSLPILIRLRKNPPGNLVISIFSGQKPNTRILFKQYFFYSF